MPKASPIYYRDAPISVVVVEFRVWVVRWFKLVCEVLRHGRSVTRVRRSVTLFSSSCLLLYWCVSGGGDHDFMVVLSVVGTQLHRDGPATAAAMITGEWRQIAVPQSTFTTSSRTCRASQPIFLIPLGYLRHSRFSAKSIRVGTIRCRTTWCGSLLIVGLAKVATTTTTTTTMDDDGRRRRRQQQRRRTHGM